MLCRYKRVVGFTTEYNILVSSDDRISDVIEEVSHKPMSL